MSGIIYETDNKSIGSFPSVNIDSKNLTYISHYHDELEVIYIRNGTISAYSGSREILLEKGDICIFMPGEIHSFQSTTQNCMDILKLSTTMYVESVDFWKIRLESNKITPDNCNYSILIDAIEKVRKEYTNKRPGYEFAIRTCKNIIMQTVIRNMKYEYADQTKSIELLNLVNKFLEINYESKISLEYAAKECHFSKYYFAHRLKEVTGATFIQYLSTFRTEKAAKLLRTTNMRITDIALKCGFNNLRSFNRQFKEVYNTTPLTYRNSSI